MNRKIIIISAVVIVALASILSFLFIFNGDEGSSFNVDSVILKVAIKSNSSLDTYIRISNLDVSSKEFNAKILDVGDLASLDKPNFEVDSEGVERVKISFFNSGIREPGIFLGRLVVSSGVEEIIVPIVVEIESEDVLFDANFDLFPTENIFPGNKINAEIKIFDLSRIGTVPVEMKYFVKDFFGKTVTEGTENPVVKSQVLIAKSFDLPKDLATGDYVFGVVMTYKESVGTSSALFSVEEAMGSGVSISYLGEGTYLIIFLIAIALIFVMFVVYSIYSRDLLMVELSNQYEQELRKQEEWLAEKQKENEKMLETREEINLNQKLFKEVKKKRINLIKKVHKKRVSQIKHLKKLNQNQEIKRQISQWKKKGYNTALLESKIKTPSVNDIHNQISQWKKKGYNTKIFENK
ncbi:MAG: hypothetical protein ABH840_04525 [Nanoarchaeota archaeon]